MRPAGGDRMVTAMTATPETARLGVARPHAPAHQPMRGRAFLGRARVFYRELLLVVGGVLLYFGGRGLTESDPAPALEHAHGLVALERALGLYWEPWLQGLVDGSHVLVTLANWVYIWGHWPVIVLTLGWLVVRHPGTYRRTRNAMAVSGAIGMVVFVLYPVAPPRLLDLGLVDTVSVHSEAYRVLQPPAFTNLYAAMPSLHVGWNLLMGIAIVSVSRRRLLRALGYLLPASMVAAVVLTANHYVVDVVAGAAVASLGLAVATWLDRRGRPSVAVARPAAADGSDDRVVESERVAGDGQHDALTPGQGLGRGRGRIVA
jgi:membrane-associated phospholipid phosphatase